MNNFSITNRLRRVFNITENLHFYYKKEQLLINRIISNIIK